MGATVVGYVLRTFPDPAQVFVGNEIRELERLGCSIRVIAYHKPSGSAVHNIFREIRAPVAYIPEPPWRQPASLAVAVAEGILFNPGYFFRTLLYVAGHTFHTRTFHTWLRFLQAILTAHHTRRAGVRHLHAHFADGPTRVAMLASRLTGTPYSFTAHARDIFRTGINRNLLREKIAGAASVIGVSEYNKRFLDEQVRHAGRVCVIYNGVDLERFRPNTDVPREPDLILAVGRLTPKKGFRDLIEACRQLALNGHRIRTRIIGDGPLREELERAASGLDVLLPGSRSQEDLIGEYQRASVLVLPSVVPPDGNSDALPTVLLEAIASGCPVISTRVAGIPEIVDHELNGLLVEPGNPQALAAAIDRLLADDQLRARFSMNARRKAEERFDIRMNAGALYREFAAIARVDTAQ